MVFDRYTAALAYQDYRTLWIANLCSGAAAWALIVARGALVYNEFESSTWVAVVTFAAMIPRVFIPPIAGYLSDKFDRRRVVSLMYAINLAQTLGLSFYVLLGDINPWVIVGMSLINGSARAATDARVPVAGPEPGAPQAAAERYRPQSGDHAGFAAVRPHRHRAYAGDNGRLGRVLSLYCLLRCQPFAESQNQYGLHRYCPSGQQLHRQLREQRLGWHQIRLSDADTQSRGVHGTVPLWLTMSFESLLPVLSDTRLNARDAGFTLLMAAVGVVRWCRS